MASERVQKLLSQAGYGSRRHCEGLIEAGRVTVNGRRILLGGKADLHTDIIELDGQSINKLASPKIYIAVNKPAGIRSDVDPADPRKAVRDLVPISGHLYPVGRLDLESEGLILLTNDGELANRLTHPRYGHEKEYEVLVVGKPDNKQLATWRRGVVLEQGIKTAPAKVFIIKTSSGTTWLRIIMHEGKKRQIREVGKTIGLPVKRIIRTRIGTLTLGNLKPGSWRYLNEKEIVSLVNYVKEPGSL